MGRKKWKPASLLVLREHFLPSAMEMIFGLELLLFANSPSPWLFSFGECVSPRAERRAPAVCQRWVMAADGIYVGKPCAIKRCVSKVYVFLNFIFISKGFIITNSLFKLPAVRDSVAP